MICDVKADPSLTMLSRYQSRRERARVYKELGNSAEHAESVRLARDSYETALSLSPGLSEAKAGLARLN
jgi:hypothetical protein